MFLQLIYFDVFSKFIYLGFLNKTHIFIISFKLLCMHTSILVPRQKKLKNCHNCENMTYVSNIVCNYGSILNCYCDKLSYLLGVNIR